MKEKLKTIISWFVFIFLIIGFVAAFSDDNNYESTPSPPSLESKFNLENEENNEIDTDEENYDYGNIYYNFDEHDYDVNRYQNLGGSYSVEACNTRTGSCYDLDADIDEGIVERIYFPSGGHLDLDGAELDEEGYTTGESYTESEGYNGDEWEINCYDCEE